MEREETQLFHDHLKRERLKRTAQRDLILDVFLDTKGHVSSEDLYALVKAKDASVGYTTVYRTLKLLKGCGLARELEFHDGRILYEHDYNQTHHDHLICTQCGALIEFYSEEIEALQDEIVRRYGFSPQHHSHRIFGVCANCQKNQAVTGAASRSVT
jgi:Fur family ferric uptake transcriptional regulator